MEEQNRVIQNRPIIDALTNPNRYPHPVDGFQILETHISWIILTGPYAYKIKKAVDLGFVNFTTVEKRKFFCEEEIRLNQRLGQELQYELVSILGPLNDIRLKADQDLQNHSNNKPNKEPDIENKENIIEYAVRMKQFDQHKLLSYLAEKNLLTLDQLHDIAKQIATFHSQIPVDTSHDRFGNPTLIQEIMFDNILSCQTLITKASSKVNVRHEANQILTHLKKWAESEWLRLKPYFIQRKQQGFIRECHGDLHLGNMVSMNNHVIIFDCIEFNPDFRWIDTMEEIALLTLDLGTRLNVISEFYFLNLYCEKTGDFEGLRVLPFYQLNRALVRAKVALLMNKKDAFVEFTQYLNFSSALVQKPHPKLIITFGVSGSGKTTLAKDLASRIGAIHIRSDTERKRIFSQPRTINANPAESLYTHEKTIITYQHLLTLASVILKAGYSVIVDATFIKQDLRSQFHQLAEELNVPFIILHSVAPLKLLHRRVFERAKLKDDNSDANIHVLNEQFTKLEPITEHERLFTIVIETDRPIDIEEVLKKINF